MSEPRSASERAASPFRGFPPEALDFYERLDADNSKAFWVANRSTYEAAVRTPMLELGAELADYGPFHLFRPYNDLRFQQKRPPYKTAQGAYGEGEGGAGHYVQISASGLLVGAGYYSMAKDQLERFRAAVDAAATGGEVARIVKAATAAGYEIGAVAELKSAPRGFPKDHARIDLLRRKGLMASRSWPPAAWLSTRKAAAKVREAWEGAAEMCAWLDAYVGPSTLAPDDGPTV